MKHDYNRADDVAVVCVTKQNIASKDVSNDLCSTIVGGRIGNTDADYDDGHLLIDQLHVTTNSMFIERVVELSSMNVMYQQFLFVHY